MGHGQDPRDEAERSRLEQDRRERERQERERLEQEQRERELRQRKELDEQFREEDVPGVVPNQPGYPDEHRDAWRDSREGGSS